MDIFDIVLLSITQGVTEFLPISSSGHLILVQNFLNIYTQELFLNIFLHVGTLMSVVITLRKEIKSMIKILITLPKLLLKYGSFKQLFAKNEAARLLFLLTIGSIPTAIIGLLLKNFVNIIFQSINFVGLMLLLTGSVLYLTKIFGLDNKKSIFEINIQDSLFIGIIQGIAIIPGLSRSGLTISLGLFLGMKRELASRFSFLLSIPTILGAMFLGLFSLDIQINATINWIFIGSIISGIIGYISLNFVLFIIKYEKLHIFSYYCYIIGFIIISYVDNIFMKTI